MVSPSRGAFTAPPKSLIVVLRVALLLLPLLALTAPREAQAYTWMIKHGYPACNACHTDPSGGELLTFYGRIISQEFLSSKWGGSGEQSGQQVLRRRYAVDPTRFAARAKLADKEGDAAAEAPAEGEPKAEGDKPAEGEAAAAGENPAEAASTEAAPAEPAAESPTDITPFMFGLFELPDWLLLGASYRHLNIIKPSGDEKFKTFPMMMDLYGQAQFGSFKVGGSIGGARVPAGSPYARPAQVTGAQGKDWNLISRTHYVGWDFSTELSVRAGRLNLPFGVRIPEHVMWVRQASRTDRESAQQHGVSVNYLAEKFRFELMGIAGNYQISPDKFRERGYSGYFEYFTGAKTSVGVSSLVTVANTDRMSPGGGSMTRMAHGGMFRTAVGEKVVFVAEIDALSRSRHDLGYTGFAQVDYEPIQGLHFMLTGEMLDEGHPKTVAGQAATPRTPGLGKPKVGGWLSASWFFLPHFDVRIDGVQRTDEDLQILAQLHVYL
jgi:hypothetical protein